MTRLGIDARVLACQPHQGLGVWRYLTRILERAPATGWDVTLFGDRPAADLPAYSFSAAFRYEHVRPFLGRDNVAEWEQLALAASSAFRRQHLFWSPSYTTPLLTRVRRVLTMHDISFDQPPPGEEPWSPRMRWLARRSAFSSRLVLTDSEFSAEQMRTHWGLAADRIRVVPLAADEPAPSWVGRRHETLERLGVSTPYVLYVGSMYSRRHVGTLIDALGQALLPRPGWNAVLVGRNRTRPHEDLEAAIAGANRQAARPAITHLPFVSDDDLHVLYGAASAFVYLSTLEGFGLPPLEAMAYGLPVISTDGGSLREITPGAAVLVDPRSADQVRSALARLMDDPEHARTCAARSLIRAREYSWDRCASATWDALRDAAND